MLSADHRDFLTIEMSETGGRKASITTNNDVDIYNLLEDVIRLLIGYGYHHESVKEAIIARSEEYLMEEEHEKQESKVA